MSPLCSFVRLGMAPGLLRKGRDHLVWTTCVAMPTAPGAQVNIISSRYYTCSLCGFPWCCQLSWISAYQHSLASLGEGGIKDSCVTNYITVIIVYVYVYLFCHAYVSEHSFVKWLRAYSYLYVISESSTQVLLMLSVVNQV